MKSISPAPGSSLIASHPASFQPGFWEGLTEPEVWHGPQWLSTLVPSQVTWPSFVVMAAKLPCTGGCFTTSLPLHKDHQLLGASTPTMIRTTCGVLFGNRRVIHNLESKSTKSLVEWSLITSGNGRFPAHLLINNPHPLHPNYLQRLSPNPTAAASVLKSRIPLLPGKNSPMVSPQSRSQLENWRGYSGERTGAM